VRAARRRRHCTERRGVFARESLGFDVPGGRLSQRQRHQRVHLLPTHEKQQESSAQLFARREAGWTKIACGIRSIKICLRHRPVLERTSCVGRRRSVERGEYSVTLPFAFNTLSAVLQPLREAHSAPFCIRCLHHARCRSQRVALRVGRAARWTHPSCALRRPCAGSAATWRLGGFQKLLSVTVSVTAAAPARARTHPAPARAASCCRWERGRGASGAGAGALSAQPGRLLWCTSLETSLLRHSRTLWCALGARDAREPRGRLSVTHAEVRV